MTIRNMNCCVCGNDAGRWKQHWNRDTGYGVCVACIKWLRGRNESETEIADLYGKEGVNWGSLYTTTISSNGSKWNGQEPDSIETLFKMLETFALDRTFENYGNFVMVEPVSEAGEYLVPNGVRFWGNFAEICHVFSIDTDDPELIERLTTAIRGNQKRADYLGQAVRK